MTATLYRELLSLEQHHQTDHRRPSARTAALRESAQHSACSCGRSVYGGGSAQWLATCAWCRAAPRQLRGSPTHTTGLHGCVFEDAVSRKISHIAVSRYGVVGAARLRRIPGQRCVGRRKLSVVSSRYSYLVMLSSTRHLVAAARPAGAVGAIGRFATSTLKLAPPVK